jgi:hypothetical protein
VGLLQEAIDAHGGLARWRGTREIVARLRSGGAALTMRGRARAFARCEVSISTTAPRVVVTPFGGPDRRGVFERDLVRIESSDGAVVAERRNPRAAFGTLRRKLWWDPLDALYFGGYALWNYFTAPFLFLQPGFDVTEVGPWVENGEQWSRLGVRFPADVPTHCREQVYYLDESRRIARLDYTAEVFGSWARAVHYCRRYETFSGLALCVRRRVFPRARSGRARPFPILVWIDVDEVAVR